MSAGQSTFQVSRVLAEHFLVQAGGVATGGGFNVGESNQEYGGSAFPEPSSLIDAPELGGQLTDILTPFLLTPFLGDSAARPPPLHSESVSPPSCLLSVLRKWQCPSHSCHLAWCST